MGNAPPLSKSTIISLISTRFGAVLEEFELHDALETVFATKDQSPKVTQIFATQQVAAY